MTSLSSHRTVSKFFTKTASCLSGLNANSISGCVSRSLSNNEYMNQHGTELFKATEELHSMIKTIKKVPQIKKVIASNLQMKKSK